MKFNIMHNIFIISISIVILSCSSTKNIINNDEEQDINSQYFSYQNIKNKSNKIVGKHQQLQIQDLQSINIVYFPLDQYHILPEFFSILDMHAVFLRNNPLYQVKIEGHTDERGTPEYNIALGERRAYSVKTYLQSKGVLSNQMYIVSYGKEKPISLGHTEESYSKNRRVVLLY